MIVIMITMITMLVSETVRLVTVITITKQTPEAVSLAILTTITYLSPKFGNSDNNGKQVSNLVLSAQSTITVISRRVIIITMTTDDNDADNNVHKAHRFGNSDDDTVFLATMKISEVIQLVMMAMIIAKRTAEALQLVMVIMTTK